MKPPHLSLIILLAWAVSASAITIETVPVGNVGNPNDPADGDSFTSGVQNYGAVSTAYNIGKYEVTVGQYTAFLNAVAANDTYSLYSQNNASDTNGAGILRNGSSGSYTYSVVGSPNRPVTYVNWGDAARFANWMHNGQPTGAEGPGTTETGAYTLNGAQGGPLSAITRNAGALWFIPTENEWYKAAYYQPTAAGGDSDGYWAYPMKTNSTPYSDQAPGATPNNTRVGNFNQDDGLANGYDDGYAMTGSTSYHSEQNYLTDVGAYTSSPSYYGTFDQGGNVWEWNETKVTVSLRGARGGSWNSGSSGLRASGRHDYLDELTAGTATENGELGFRLASAVVPEPSSALLAVGIVLLLAGRPPRR